MTRPILYSFRRCPYAMRGRLAIARAGIQVELREILLRDKAPEMLEASPKGTVPVLVLPNGAVIDESYDIMNWALGEGAASAEERALVQSCDRDFKPWLDRFKYPNKYEGCSREAAISNAGLFLDTLESRLANNSFLFGHARGFADIGIAPFVRQFAHVDREWFLNSKWSYVIAWYQEFIEWDGFLAIMSKYPKWVQGDAVTLFPENKTVSDFL